MKEVDITEIFKNMRRGKQSESEKNEMIQDLVDKIENRAEEIRIEKANAPEVQSLDEEEDIDVDIEDEGTFKDIGLYNFNKEGEVEKKDVNVLDGQDEGDDFYLV